ncbi:MAG TPA: nitrilase-related carbon-nitrogen hydrolase [Solirubrobacteraceae bacterium]
MRSLLAQRFPVPGAPQDNARRAAEIVAGADADVVVLPELWLSGYDLERVHDSAVELDSPELGVLRESASDAATAIVVGFPERRGGRVANAVALIDERGELGAVYRKVQLFGYERDVFEAGDELVVAELAGRRVGPLICFDMEFPELARALARAGADLLVTASANMEPFYGDHQIASQARALDNRLPHLYCNRCGVEAGLVFVGGSRAVRPDGTIAAQAGGGEELLAADVERVETGDDRIDYLAQLREGIGVKAATTVTGGST